MASSEVARRGFLGAVLGGTAIAAGGAGLGVGLAAATPVDCRRSASDAASDPAATLPFYGEHQTGIDTPASASCAVAAYDVLPEIDKPRMLAAFGILTDDLRRMTQGGAALADTAPMLANEPGRLSVTVGIGPSLLQRYGLPFPEGFGELPAFPKIDQLHPEYSGGDLMLLIASDDPMAVAHAQRMITKDLKSFVTPRWVQRGFLNTPAQRSTGATPRNLFGQIDGTVNPAAGTKDFESSVWIKDGIWAGGTTIVVRRIRFGMDKWDSLDPAAMNAVIGRKLTDGAPLTGSKESDTPDLEATTKLGLPVILDGAHVRLAKAASKGEQILRRPYNYDASNTGGSDMGQIFMSYQRNIASQFVPVQQRLAEGDLFNEWTTPIGSAVFAILPGCREGEILGRGVFS